MKLIIGLGNVGEQYHATRHNIGFGVVEMIAIGFGKKPSDFSKHSKAQAETLDLKTTHDCILVKPTTMMNLSGQAIGELARFYKVDPADVWVIYDEVDMQFGQLRIRRGGGSAGHNGIKSIIQHIGDGFWRIRLGIANQYLSTTPTDKFVLDPFMAGEAAQIPQILEKTARLVEDSLLAGDLKDHTQNLLV